MADSRLARVLAMFEQQDRIEEIAGGGTESAAACLERAEACFAAATLLFDAGSWETAFTNAYDAYRMAADAVVLGLGYRVRSGDGGHRTTLDIADATFDDPAGPFASRPAERFRAGRNEAQYFDPDRPVDKTEADAQWAIDRARTAIEVVRSSLA
jgi:hypothetical protein